MSNDENITDDDLLQFFSTCNNHKDIYLLFVKQIMRHEKLNALILNYQKYYGNPKEGKGIEDTLRESWLTPKGNGHRLYRYYCASCHGADGEGGIGPMLHSKALLGIFLNHIPDLYRNTLEYGRPGTKMASYMHKNYGIFNNNQIENIINFFQEQWYQTDETDTSSELPIYPLQEEANVVDGKRLFQNHCADCHGTLGEGGIGPAICNYYFIGYKSYDNKLDQRELEPVTISDHVLRAIIMQGRNTMPGFAPKNSPKHVLSELEIDSIIKYMRNNPIRVPNTVKIPPVKKE